MPSPGARLRAMIENGDHFMVGEAYSALTGRIVEHVGFKAAYLGGHMEYTVTTDFGERFVIDENVRTPFASGSDVAISFADHGVTLVPND